MDNTQEHQYEFVHPPTPVGWWEIGGYLGIRFAVYKEFTPEQIKNTEELLGWEWKEHE